MKWKERHEEEISFFRPPTLTLNPYKKSLERKKCSHRFEIWNHFSRLNVMQKEMGNQKWNNSFCRNHIKITLRYLFLPAKWKVAKITCRARHTSLSVYEPEQQITISAESKNQNQEWGKVIYIPWGRIVDDGKVWESKGKYAWIINCYAAVFHK